MELAEGGGGGRGEGGSHHDNININVESWERIRRKSENDRV